MSTLRTYEARFDATSKYNIDWQPYSEGNLQFRKAPQQDAHFVPSLRSVQSSPGRKKWRRRAGRAFWAIWRTCGLTSGNFQVADPSTSRSTPVPPADTQLPRSDNVRLRHHNSSIRYSSYATKQLSNTKANTDSRQLGWEGQEKKDHRFRPHASLEDRPKSFQERLPDRCPKGLQGSSC